MKERTKITVGLLACVFLFSAGQDAFGHESTNPPPAPASLQVRSSTERAPFYNALVEYGNWMQVDPFGLVWQPTIVKVNSKWKPYCDGGKWVWRNNAWCWQSEYDWGKIPFHYGRWRRQRQQ